MVLIVSFFTPVIFDTVFFLPGCVDSDNNDTAQHHTEPRFSSPVSCRSKIKNEVSRGEIRMEHPLQETPKAAPKPRSPRSQREACIRLSQPRKPKKEEDVPEEVEAEEAEEVEMEEMEEMEEEVEDEEVPEVPEVQIIPSMLAQCSPRLERIDEEAEKPRRARPGRSKTPSGSTGPTPYAAPVCPRKYLEIKPEKPRRSKKDELSREELTKLASFLAEGGEAAESEAMLNDIDALYSQLIKAGVDELEASEEPINEEVSPVGRMDEQEEVEMPMPPPEMSEMMSIEQFKQFTQLGDGDELLTAIDELYSQMLSGGKEVKDEDELSAKSPKADVQSSEEEGELSSLLEDTSLIYVFFSYFFFNFRSARHALHHISHPLESSLAVEAGC